MSSTTFLKEKTGKIKIIGNNLKISRKIEKLGENKNNRKKSKEIKGKSGKNPEKVRKKSKYSEKNQ